MFKTGTAIYILLAFAAHTLHGPFILLHYYLNTASYAQNCINKAQPNNHCNGKCQAMKKIREAEKKQPLERYAAYKEEVLSSKSFYTTVPLLPPCFKGKAVLPYTLGKPIHQPRTFFHPPCTVYC